MAHAMSRLVAVTALFFSVCQAMAQSPAGPAALTPSLYADVIDIAPWGAAGDDGRPAGVYSDIFKLLSARSGCTLEQRLTPIPRAVAEVSANAAQATIMLDRDDLNRNAIALGEVASLHIEVWLPPGSKLREFSDLEGKTVGVLRGPTYHEAFDQNQQIKKYSVLNPRHQLEMLLKGRLDAVIGVRENFVTAAGQLKLPPGLFPPPMDLGVRTVKLWVSPKLGADPCSRRLKQALQDLRRSGDIDKLIAQGSSKYPPDLNPLKAIQVSGARQAQNPGYRPWLFQ